MSITKFTGWKTSDGVLHESIEAAERHDALSPFEDSQSYRLVRTEFDRSAIFLYFGDLDSGSAVAIRAIVGEGGIPKLVVNKVR